MSLPSYVPRCPGRYAPAFGQPSIAHECFPCVRRTDRPEGVTLQFMQPPAQRWCQYQLLADDVETDE